MVGVRGAAEALVNAARNGAETTVFLADAEQAGAWMRGNLRAGDAVLVKASRGVCLERAVEALDER